MLGSGCARPIVAPIANKRVTATAKRADRLKSSDELMAISSVAV
jgi:hypothetical protein